MKLNQFKYTLPESLIAKYPSEYRDECRLMVLDRKKRSIEHKVFKDLLDIFDEGDLLIANNAKVFPARLYGSKEKTGAKIEVFLLRELNKEMRLWDVLVDPARKIRVGNKLYFGDNDLLVAEVIDNTTSRGRTIRFLFDGNDDELRKTIESLGETPIPKYLKRDVEEMDKERYQTVFAKKLGAVAAPSSGLHFSRELLKRLEIKGVDFAEVTLYNGLGAYKPVEVEDLTKHKMESENYEIDAKAAEMVNSAIRNKKRVCAVGTSSMRAIESSVSSSKTLNPSSGWTDKFLFPPYEFNIANCFITSFHAPESTLMMMAAAFADYDFLKEAYDVAMKEKYNFLCYGDAMLIL